MSTPRRKCPCGYDHCGYYVDENGEVVESVKPLEPTRQEFEKWGDETLGWRHEDFARESKRFHSGESYESPEVQVAWLAWQAYAAAVSKNLTDKYAEMEAKWMRELLTVSNEIGEARDRISDLLNHDGGPGSIDYDAAKVFRARAKLLEFREIAALRETK